MWIHPRGRARVADLLELEALPNGVEVFVPEGVDEGQVAFHIVPEQALVVAEFFLGINGGLQVLPSPGTRNRAAFAASLDQLRNLSIERVLVAHGPPVLERGEDAIRAALDAFATRDAGKLGWRIRKCPSRPDASSALAADQLRGRQQAEPVDLKVR